MINVVAFSGGKDSTALLLWMKEKGIEHKTVFCDTGWEHPVTYAYVRRINEALLDGELITVRSEKYKGGMDDLVYRKKRVPSVRARFCTEELKVIPMINWLRAQPDETQVFQGIRAEESESRSRMKPQEWSDAFDCVVSRPLFYWKSDQVFDIMKRHGIEPNPLYALGAGRVGCFPCVLINHGELKRVMTTLPEVWDRIEELEGYAGGRSFFPPNYIPDRFQTGFDPKSGKTFPTAQDVKQYIIDRNDIDMDAPAPACLSVYNLCE